MVLGEGAMKLAANKALVVKTNLVFLAVFLVVVYMTVLLLQPPLLHVENASAIVAVCTTSLRGCHPMKKIEEKRMAKENMYTLPSFFEGLLHRGATIGAVNVDEDEALEWAAAAEKAAVVRVAFEPVSDSLEWKHLFPEWIDEEEENEGPPPCPEIPMPDFSAYEIEVDVVAARLPCRHPAEGWSRDPRRLQVHLVAAKMAVRKGRRDGRGKVRVAVASGACRPMMELFRCDDLVGREGEWWVYEVDVGWLAEKVGMPVGSCKLALPLWSEGTNDVFNSSKLIVPAVPYQREAYATVLHSSNMYVCGAIVLAQSILKAGTTRDLILLHDKSIPRPKLDALAAAGWQLREIKRIRNPLAERNSYNEYNYSKLRLWQLTDYRKIVFIDADIAVLRSLDILFHFPQISAVGNDGVIFNSGIMVLEPSSCTFKALMGHRKDIISYNGGDQGFLNEVFVWWHRVPRRVNFLKNFWANTTAEATVKNTLFAADPPKLYSIHYLGFKPWLCYREYDCNFNVGDHKVYASDEAHQRWWKVHDEMDKGLQRFCGLPDWRRAELELERKNAQEMRLADGHWKIEVSNSRRSQ